MANKNGRKIFISLFVGVVVACISLNTFSKMQKELKEKEQLIQVMKLHDKQLEDASYNYLTFTHDMEAGETVKDSDVMLTAFSTEQENAINNKDDVIGNVLIEPVKNGQVLTEYVFTGIITNKPNSSKGLKDGYRALTLSTSTLDGMSKEMKTGALVDVFSKTKNSQIVLSKVRILALEPNEPTTTQQSEQTKTSDIAITQAKSVTFEVPVNKIQELVDIYSSGKILLVMRPVGDETIITGNKKTPANTSKSYNSSSSYNTNYSSATIPALPQIQSYEEPIITELPAPVKPKKASKTVEIIEASNKTQVNFD